MNWQPIETAPKDGTKIIAWHIDKGARETQWEFYGEGSIARANFLKFGGPSGHWGWHEPIHNWAGRWSPTHWQPLPEPPK